jgi:hypothetical protein
MVSSLREAAGKPKQDREKLVSSPFSIRWCDPFMSFPLQIMPSPFEFFPVSSFFPCPPISVQFSVRDASIFSSTEIWRQVKQRIRYVCWAYISPMPIAAGSSVPTPFMGAIPVPVIEKDVRSCIWAKVGICPRYHNHWGRCRPAPEEAKFFGVTLI